MSEKYPSLPNWTFDVSEIANGCYRVRATHYLGCSVESVGGHADVMIEEVKRSAAKMEEDLRELAAKKGQAGQP